MNIELFFQNIIFIVIYSLLFSIGLYQLYNANYREFDISFLLKSALAYY
jgi:hypothetical protein